MPRRVTRILVPTDFSATSDVALDYAISVAARFDASLNLLHVIDDPFVGAQPWGSEAYIASVPEMRASLIDRAAAKMADLVQRAAKDGVQARSEVRTGRPADVIRDAARDEHCDLVVMGTHGRTGVAHLLLGSVAERMVRESPCPVLTVRRNPDGDAIIGTEIFDEDLAPTE